MPLYLLNNGSVESELNIDGVTTPLTFSVADMKQPDKRRTSSSKTITLKGTANNMRILKNVYNLTGANLDTQILQYTFDPRVRVECIYEEGEEVLFDGLFQVLKAVKNNGNYEFECLMFSNIANIFNKLKDVTIADLPWSEYNHLLDKDIIRDSWDTSVEVDNVTTSNFTSGVPDGFGYIYSWMDFGLPYNGSPVRQRTNQLTLGVYFREVLQKIMEYVEESDYTFTLNDEEFFKRLVMFNEGGETPKITAAEIALREVDRTDKLDYESDYPVLDPLYPIDTNGDFNTTVNLNYSDKLGRYTTAVGQDDLNQVMPSGSLVRYVKIAKTGLYQIDLTGDLYFSLVGTQTDMTWSRSFENIALRILKNGQNIKSFPLAADLEVLGSKQEELVNYNLSGEFFLNEGDEIEIELTYSSKYALKYAEGVVKPDDVTLTVESKTDDQNLNITALESDIQDGSNVYLTRFLPKMKCSDWLRSFMRMFNIYQIEEEDKTIKFVPAKDYYQSTSVSDQDNWTELLDHSEKIEIEPPNRIKGKFYEMAFTEESDFYNEKYFEEWATNYGNKVYEIGNTWQEGTNKIDIGFSQGVPVQLAGSEVIMPAIYKEKNGEVEAYKGKAPRIYFYNGMTVIPEADNCSIHPSNGDWAFSDIGTPLFLDDGVDFVYPSFHHTLNLDSPEFDLVFELPRRVFYIAESFTTGNLWSIYWDKFIQELTSSDAKIFTGYFKLNRNLIKNLDFSRLKNIDGVLYRLNVVEDYIANENITVKCELIKIIKGDRNFAQSIDNIPKLPDSKEDNLSGGDDNNDTGTGISYGGVTAEKSSNIIYG